jgi:hypothetical protein
MTKFVKSLYVDMNLFKKVFLYGVGFFVSLFVIVQLFTKLFEQQIAKITTLGGITDISQAAVDQINVEAPGLGNALLLLLLFIVLFFFILLAAYAFFENLSWNAIFKRKTTFKNTSRFFAFNLLLGIALSAIVGVIFAIISKFTGSWIKFGVTVFYLSAIIAGYILYVGYVSFGRTQEIFESIKNAFVISFKRVDVTILPVVAAFVIFLVVNMILLAFQNVHPILFTMIQGIGVAAYLAWFRIYFANVLKPVKF